MNPKVIQFRTLHELLGLFLLFFWASAPNTGRGLSYVGFSFGVLWLIYQAGKAIRLRIKAKEQALFYLPKLNDGYYKSIAIAIGIIGLIGSISWFSIRGMGHHITFYMCLGSFMLLLYGLVRLPSSMLYINGTMLQLSAHSLKVERSQVEAIDIFPDKLILKRSIGEPLVLEQLELKTRHVDTLKTWLSQCDWPSHKVNNFV